MNRVLASLLALLFASLAISSACFAGPYDQPARRLVFYDDLDLSTPAGIKAVNRRVEQAAIQLCLDWSGPSPGAQRDLGCMANARTNALWQIEDAIARQRSARSPANAIEARSAPILKFGDRP